MAPRKSSRIYKRTYLFVLLGLLLMLSLSILLQVRLSQQFPAYAADNDAHRHQHGTIFSDMQSVMRVSSYVGITATQPNCTYWNCIDSYKCVEDGLGKISVYVYDIRQYVDSENAQLLPAPSREYIHILWAIANSKYAVTDPKKACILIPSVDLLNRQQFSGDSAARVLAALPFWNNGTNHLIFNMISCAAPMYLSTLDFPHGSAMLTGSGFTQRSYRRTFDIAIPLFNPHQRSEDFIERDRLHRSILVIAAQRTFYKNIYDRLLTLTADKSGFVLITKCAKQRTLTSRGSRCDPEGNVYSYPSVLTNAKFCLLTRERQLANTYLHDILRAGCVPVVCTDMYVMPFSDVLDWKRAAVFINEYRLDETYNILNDLLDDGDAYRHMKEQGRFFYENYFQSLAKIALVTLDILTDRILPYRSRPYEHWNRPLVPDLPRNPFFVPLIPSQKQGFTAVVLTYDRFELMKQVVRNIARSKSVAKIIVIWNNPQRQPPPDSQWPIIPMPLKIIRSKHNRLSNRFYPYNDIETDCVLTIDDDITMLPADELEFGYRVWTENADRLVGFPPRYHSFNQTEVKYESEWMSNISMVLTGAAFYHKYYHYLFTSALPGNIKQWVDEHMNCEDIAMNYLIATVTGKAPIKLLARKKFKSTASSISSGIISHLVARNACMKKFTDAFGAMPLRTVEFRADPVLFKQEGYTDDMKVYRSDGEL